MSTLVEPLDEDELLILYNWKEDSDKVRTTWVDGRKYTNLAMEIGRRGTKSIMVSFITLYEFYKLINLDKPAVHYGFLNGAPLHIFIIAQSLDQVKDTIFSAIAGYAKRSNYFKALESKGKIEILTEKIRCPDKNVHIHAEHTNSKSLVGYNLKLIVIVAFEKIKTTTKHYNSVQQLITFRQTKIKTQTTITTTTTKTAIVSRDFLGRKNYCINSYF